MDSTITDKETIRSVMGLAAAVLVFISTMATIVNSRLQKARNAVQRERVISITFDLVNLGFCIAALVVVLTTNYRLLSLNLYLCAVLVYILKFLRNEAPASRGEIVMLVVWVADVVMILTLYFMIRIVGVIEEISRILDVLTQK